MDNRLTFLYCVMTELRGRMRRRMCRETEDPAQAGEGPGRKIRQADPGPRREAKRE